MIVLLSPYLPARDAGGCARKVFDYLRFAHRRGHEVVLFSFCSESDRARVPALKGYCADIHLEYVRDYRRYPIEAPALTGKIKDVCRSASDCVVQCEMSFMARYLPEVDVPSFLVEHEILSSLFFQQATFERDSFRKLALYGRSLKKFVECWSWYRKFERIIVFSREDQDRLRRWYLCGHTEVIPLGIDLDDYQITPPPSDRSYDLIFVGSFSHAPNVDAVMHFCEKILPLIREKYDRVSVLFAGAEPPQRLSELAQADQDITVTGFVPDVLAYYAKSRVFVAPLRCGTGACFKILEALAMQMPIVATSTAVRGFEVKGQVMVADDPQEFADQVIDLLAHPAKRSDLAGRARQGIGARHGWDHIWGQYEELYHRP